MRGLIVEASPVLRLLLVRAFRAAGFESPVHAAGLPDALRQLRGPVDFIITDGNTSHREGLALVSQLRSSPEAALIPIVMITAQRLRHQQLEALVAGADACVVKPFTPENLSRAVAAAVSTHRHCVPILAQ